ncbi:hypothetical protein [Streptomyces sp. NPDC017435]|uniref:hypothetical protein n=1 Tax=Streptomyces sp. NPDC017435 TaxID=3364995 RepID=UPI0037AF7526
MMSAALVAVPHGPVVLAGRRERVRVRTDVLLVIVFSTFTCGRHARGLPRGART